MRLIGLSSRSTQGNPPRAPRSVPGQEPPSPSVERPPRAVVIVGPTSVGKTHLALRLASIVNAEVVSADSRQVYRYLDVGTGKPTAAERSVAPHHLLDVVAPDQHFDAVDFAHLARQAIKEITGRGRRVIVCGGSGLYIKALLHGLFPGPKADPALRNRLAAEQRAGGAGFLHRRLAARDPETAARLHPNDLVRVVRALEVWELTGRPLSELQHTQERKEPPCEALIIGLWRERQGLRAAIASRCAAMVAEGLVDEVRGLWKWGYGPELAPLRTLGYRHMGSHLRGERTVEEALADMTADTCRYAKRQLTWFRGDSGCHWYHAVHEEDAALEAGCRFLEGGER